MKEILAIVSILIVGGAALAFRPTAHAQQFFKLDSPAAVQTAQAEQIPPKTQTAVTEAPVQPQSKPVETPPPVTCGPNQWVRADNGQCLDKPAIPSSGYANTVGSGSCESEIAKYDWGQSTAIAVARAESGLNPGIVNNNPSTRDYSVGCFQINIYGANARTRPSEGELKNAATNVAFAYKIYVGNGHSFIGQWGVCNYKVNCY